MKKICLLFMAVAFMAGCGVTKIDIPPPIMEKIKVLYPEATGGYIIIKTKPSKK